MASELESFNARGDRQKEAVVLPTAEELVRKERDAWQRFFGKEIDVPNHPEELIKTLERLSELGILGFEAHYLPKVSFAKDDEFPGWKVKPDEWFWNEASIKAKSLSGNWVLNDGRPKPKTVMEYYEQMYKNDFLAPLIERLSQEGRVKHFQPKYRDYYLPDGSIFSISWEEIHWAVLPELKRMIGVPHNQLRLPKAIEFNVLGNIHHPEWGEVFPQWWFEDEYAVEGHLIRGGSGGLARIDYAPYEYQSDTLGFWPLVEFPQK